MNRCFSFIRGTRISKALGVLKFDGRTNPDFSSGSFVGYPDPWVDSFKWVQGLPWGLMPFNLLFAVVGCSDDLSVNEGTLDHFLTNKEMVLGNVIACAASNENDDRISVFFYPRDGASNFHYFETADGNVDQDDFMNYTQIEAPIDDVFNGYLKKYDISATVEKWVIVSFEENGKTHLSNPIRLKQLTKPTEYPKEHIVVDTEEEGMPIFTWTDGIHEGTVIYFQVVSDLQNNLLSGTYTFDKMFQYYKLDNVVLNITPGIPPDLLQRTSHNFTILSVSEDNWVNLFSEAVFELE